MATNSTNSFVVFLYSDLQWYVSDFKAVSSGSGDGNTATASSGSGSAVSSGSGDGDSMTTQSRYSVVLIYMQ